MKKNFSVMHKLFALIAVYTLLMPVFVFAGAAANDTKIKSLSEDQKIMHVLNRLGFGARPGDVERVKALGLNKYIEQQLNGNAPDSADLTARLKNYEVLDMTTAEIFAKYPNPGALLRQMNGGKKGIAAKNAAEDAKNAAMKNSNDAQMSPNGQMPAGQMTAQNQNNPNQPVDLANMSDDEKRVQREKLKEFYQEYNLRPANQIVGQMQSSRIIRATYSENQLQEQMVDFWMNHFNVYAGKAAVKWYIPAYERDVIRKNALGNFRDLLVGTAQSPAMLFYLDNFQSISPNADKNNKQGDRLRQALANGQLNPQMRERMRRRGMTDEQIDQRVSQVQNQAKKPKQERGINENYARELMELHTLGVDGGYTQKDIGEVAKAFTGWTIADPRGYKKMAYNEISGNDDNKKMNRLQKMAGIPGDLESGEFYFNSNWHEGGDKTVLGQKVSEGGIKDGLKVIDILVQQPATAKFIAKKLAVKFVSDNPSDALVSRVADAFHKSNGDIKTTLRALFTDTEFYAPETYRAKIKTPFELMVSSLRALDADVKASPALIGLLNKMGEPLYGYIAPTGYPDKAEDWVNTGALLERMNFAVALASNRIPQAKVNLTKYDAASKQAVMDKAVSGILGGEINANTKQMLVKQAEQPLIEPTLKDAGDEAAMEMTAMQTGGKGGKGYGGQNAQRLLAPSGNADVFKVVGLILGSPDFQRQ